MLTNFTCRVRSFRRLWSVERLRRNRCFQQSSTVYPRRPLGAHLGAPAHDEHLHEGGRLLALVVVGVPHLCLAREDQYLPNESFCLERVVGSSSSKGIGFLLEPGQQTRSCTHRPHPKHGHHTRIRGKSEESHRTGPPTKI